jgi:hypothetical protein
MKKKLVIFIAMFALFFSFGFVTVSASEVTTTETITTQEGVTTEAVTETPFDFDIDDSGTVYINGQEVSKSQLIEMLTLYLNEQFGEYLGSLAWILGIIATMIVSGALLLFKRLGTLIKTYRELNVTNTQAVTVKSNVDENTAAIKQAEARAAKSEAINSVLLEMTYQLFANSSNPQLVALAPKYKEETQKILAIEDNIPDALQIVKQTSNTIAKTIIGETIKQTELKKQALIDQINNSSKE